MAGRMCSLFGRRAGAGLALVVMAGSWPGCSASEDELLEALTGYRAEDPVAGCIPAGPDDKTCDGVDDDCDGETDEDYRSVATTCGVGACASIGHLSCSAGQEADSCVPGEPSANDATCDGIDDDCNGETDEDYVPVATACGVGACASVGRTACLLGQETDSCAPGLPSANDATCNGIDDDCSGETDEDYRPVATTCGVGACASVGQRSCWEGEETDSCAPGLPSANDATCNAIDDDCNGETDEDYAPTNTACGVGACTSAGQRSCSEGEETDSCVPGQPSADDTTCDSVDNDCDGDTDEDYLAMGTTCGMGACASVGLRSCSEGEETDSCLPGLPEIEVCDELDNDCDGQTDEGEPINPEDPPQDRWIRVCPTTFMMGSPGPECAAGCTCGDGANQCRDPRCQPGSCPGAEPGRGSDETQHRVTLSRAFEIQATEVTQGQYRERMPPNPSYFQSCGDDCPVEQVSWYQAVAYCNALSVEAGVERCYKAGGEDYDDDDAAVRTEPEWPRGLDCPGYRLPTEAEWEMAARAGSRTALYNGDASVWDGEVRDFDILGDRNAPALDPIAWYGGNSGVEYAGGENCSSWPQRQYPEPTHCGTQPVAGKLANPWGLYDMLGNVWEWCWDEDGSYNGDEVDPVRPPEAGGVRVVRGGSWGYGARGCRSADRGRGGPGDRNRYLGFRCVRPAPSRP